jgi:uracil-DNA glycosylase family 4
MLFDSPAPPCAGWPGDPATPHTAVASTPAQVAAEAAKANALDQLDALVSVCRACPRLVDWRERIAVTKRKAFDDEPYWGRPVPGWGASRPRLLIVGLAPAAHGANRTGRVFTGDRSGDVLFAALHRAGLAAEPTSLSAYDDQRLVHTRITLPVRCAPPANSPTPQERDACAPWLSRELELLLPTARAFVVLGGFGWTSTWGALRSVGAAVPVKVPAFGHGREVPLGGGAAVLGCYHVSQQNTFTGRLTEAMLDGVFGRAKELAGLS